ncbi:MAG: hypothetical protein FJ096_09915 [Deltaproteobacteria bacterium]|nr:hypothetical protein [Deltaproteobacteria bacterium]
MKTRSLSFPSVALLLVALAGACADELLPPVADAGQDLSSVVVGSTVQLDGTKSSDPAQLPLDYAWSFVEVPAGSHATLEASTTAKPFFTADRSGK